MVAIIEKKSEELKLVKAKQAKLFADAKRAKKLRGMLRQQPKSAEEICDNAWTHWLEFVFERRRIRSLMRRVWGGARRHSAIPPFPASEILRSCQKAVGCPNQ